MTPEQCKAARVLLSWSRADLAEAADLPELVVEMFEADRLVGLPSCDIAMRDVMTAAGIGFSDLSYEARRSLDSVTYTPPATRYVIRPRKRQQAPTSPLGALGATVRHLYESAFGASREYD